MWDYTTHENNFIKWCKWDDHYGEAYDLTILQLWEKKKWNSIRTGLISPSPRAYCQFSFRMRQSSLRPRVKGKLMPDVIQVHRNSIVIEYLLLQFKCAPDQLSKKFEILTPKHWKPSTLLKEKNSSDFFFFCKAFVILILHQNTAWSGDVSKRHFAFRLWL